MKIKRYEAQNMKDGLERVKADLGSRAIILSAKDVKPAGAFWSGKRSMVEIIAANDGSPRYEPKPRQEASSDLMGQLGPIREDICDLKDVVSRVAFPRVTLPPIFDRVFQEMVFQGVRDELALQLTLDAVQHLTGPDHDKLSDRAAVIESVTRRLPPSGQILLGGSEKAKIVALVGPTGMGKTTTVAKLAAQFAFRTGKHVSILTIDSYRIAAIEQMKIYGSIMNLPVDVANCPGEMREVLRGRRGMDLILIDTAGRSHRDRVKIEELKQLLDGFPVTKHLVLSCHTKERELREIVSRFSCLGLDRLLFTKLDEATTFGTMVNMYDWTKLPISYLTIGQKVPEDICEATPKRISDLIFSMRPLKRAGPENLWREDTTPSGTDRGERYGPS